MSSTGKRLNHLTLQQKVDIIHASRSGTRRKEIMAQYGLPASTLSCLLRRQDQLLRRIGERNFSPTARRIRPAVSPELEERMRTFVSECRREEVPLTGNLMVAKAKEFAATLGLTNFCASNGWLSNFKKRHGICLKKGKIMINLPKADPNSIKSDQNSKPCTSVTEDQQTETRIDLPQEASVMDEDLVTVDEPLRFETDTLKLESFDDDTPNDDMYGSRSNEFGGDKFENTARSIASDDKRTEPGVGHVNTGGCSGARVEDELDSFGRYIASALRALPGRASVQARAELLNTLSQAQLRCME